MSRKIRETSAASGLDYHLAKNKLFYTDTDKRKVFKMPLDESTKGQSSSSAQPRLTDYSLPGAWSPVSVAVDWVGNNIYVVDALGQKV